MVVWRSSGQKPPSKHYPVVFTAKYVSGLPTHNIDWNYPKGESLRITIVDDRITFRKPDRVAVTEDLADLKYIAYEDAGTKTNVGAVAFLGVLGLGARKNWTLLSLGFPENDLQLLIRQPVYEVRSALLAGNNRNPELVRLAREGLPPSAPTEPTPREIDAKTALLDDLERLATLYKDGLLTDEEFTTTKAKLINPDPPT